MAGAAAAEVDAATDASESASGVEEASLVGVAAAAAATSIEGADTCSVCLSCIATEAFGAAIATCAVGSAPQS